MTPARETAIGAAVLGILVLVVAWNAADLDQPAEQVEGYRLTAVFQRTDGLSNGAQVRLAGIPVGRVAEQVLDERYRAHVTLRIDRDVALPEDSAAIIETDGLLGAKYVELQPGGAEDMLEPGSRMEYTQDAVVIEDLLAKIVAQAKARRGLGASPSGGEGAAGASAPAVPEEDGAAEPQGGIRFPSLLGGDQKG